MKELKNFINESTLNIEDNIENDNKDFIKEQVIKFINDYYLFSHAECLDAVDQKLDFAIEHIKLSWKNNKYIIDIPTGSLIFNKSLKNLNELTDGYFEWGEIGGYFDCGGTYLTSLKGSPKKVGRVFSCSGCRGLVSLEGGPYEVGECFDCSSCCDLTSLKGAPEKVKSFNCAGCDNLRSLEGVPEKLSGFFNCSGCDNITSLKGAPKKVGYYFQGSCCDSLTTLEGGPKEVGGLFDCSECKNLRSLEGAPKLIGGYLWCESCENLKLTDSDCKKYRIRS